MIALNRHPTDPTTAVMYANGMWVIIAPNDVVRFRTIDGAQKWLDKRREWQANALKTATGEDVAIVTGNIDLIDWQAEKLRGFNDALNQAIEKSKGGV
jgi:hypothetical protein